MQSEQHGAGRPAGLTAGGEREEDPPAISIPPAFIGALLFLTVVLALAFYIAAQVVQTP